MKKYLFFAVFLIFVLIMTGCKTQLTDVPLNIETESAQLKVVPATTTVKQGDLLTFDIAVLEIAELYAFQLELSYDSNVLEFQQTKEGTFLNKDGQDKSFCIDPTVFPGLISKIICTRLGEGFVGGSGSLLTLTFKAIAAGESDITISDVKLAKSDTDGIPVVITNGKVIVE